LINLKRRKMGFQGIKQRPNLRGVWHRAVNQQATCSLKQIQYQHMNVPKCAKTIDELKLAM